MPHTRLNKIILLTIFHILFFWMPLSLAKKADAHSEIHPPFAEYTASYHLHWHGLHVGKSNHTVRLLEKNHYKAEVRTEPSFAIIPLKDFESSKFVVKKNEIQPLVYEFLTRDKRRSVVGQLNFNWQEKHVLKKLETGTTTQLELPEKAHDLITQLFQVRQDLRMGKQQFDFIVVGPKGIKSYYYEVIGEETLKTPAGTFNTVIVEHYSKKKDRITRLWLAKELDFVMVRLMQIRKGKVTAEAVIDYIK